LAILVRKNKIFASPAVIAMPQRKRIGFRRWRAVKAAGPIIHRAIDRLAHVDSPEMRGGIKDA
jgi:hypothetical protein